MLATTPISSQFKFSSDQIEFHHRDGFLLVDDVSPK